MNTVQDIDGKLYVCEIDSPLWGKSFVSGDYNDYLSKWKERMKYRLATCPKIPCDINPKWKELVNKEVVEGVDYITAYAHATLNIDNPQPEYLEISTVYGEWLHTSDITFSVWLEQEGYKLVKP